MNAEVLVRFDGWNRPLAVRYDDRIWVVENGSASVHWYSRPDGPEMVNPPVPRREDANGVENWRVQVRSAALSPIRVFLLQRDSQSSVWHLLGVTDEA
jgi:hypothetical protein